MTRFDFQTTSQRRTIVIIVLFASLSILLLFPMFWNFDMTFVNETISRTPLRRLLSEESLYAIKKEFDQDRMTYLTQDKEKTLKKIDNVMNALKSDPGAGYPAGITPKPEERFIVRHILIYNRLSPPNSLRVGETSKKYEFSAWINHSPGEKCEVILSISSQKHALFSDTNLLVNLPNTVNRDIKRSNQIDIKWSGNVFVRHLRKSISVTISAEAEPNKIVEFKVDSVVYKGNKKRIGYEYKAFANPRIIRWRIGAPAPVIVTVNKGKPLIAKPDGRKRKAKVRFYNQLISEDEFITVNIGPYIADTEMSPTSIYSGLTIHDRSLSDKIVGMNWKKEWRKLFQSHRADKAVPYFEYEKYWPWVLCAHPEVITTNEATLNNIRNSIPVLNTRLGLNIKGTLGTQAKIQLDKNGRRDLLRKQVQQYVCKPIREQWCNPRKNSLYCGIWPQKLTVLYRGFQSNIFAKKSMEQKFTYSTHPKTPVGTPITMLYGVVAGVKTPQKKLQLNPRLKQYQSYYKRNSFSYVSERGLGKILIVHCPSRIQINSIKCCYIKLPVPPNYSFTKDKPEGDFSIIVTTPNPALEQYTYFRIPTAYNRLSFHKSLTKVGGLLAKKQYFCVKPTKFGNFKLMLQMAPPCYPTDITCQDPGAIKNKRIGKNSPAKPIPQDFKAPMFKTIFVPSEDMKSIHIFTGDIQAMLTSRVSQVTNGHSISFKIILGGDIDGQLTITPMNDNFEFKPEFIRFNKGGMPFDSFTATPNVDCVNPDKIQIIVFQIDDKLAEFQWPTSTYLQITPDPKISEIVICDIDDTCTENELCDMTPAQIGDTIFCESDEGVNSDRCGSTAPLPPKDKRLRIIAMYALYGCAGLVLLSILYRNCMGADANTLALLQSAVSDLKTDNFKLPSDALDAKEFLKLAGLEADKVFDVANPDPVLVAEAELSLQKMLSVMKKR